MNDDILDIPEVEECEICPSPATVEHDGLSYCEDCFETDVLHN